MYQWFILIMNLIKTTVMVGKGGLKVKWRSHSNGFQFHTCITKICLLFIHVLFVTIGWIMTVIEKTIFRLESNNKLEIFCFYNDFELVDSLKYLDW